MFEGILEQLLLRLVGDYVEDVDRKQLQVSVWRGDVVLNNIRLKPRALEALRLPVRLVEGRITKLRLQVPWHRIVSDPVVVTISGVYAFIVPASPGGRAKSRSRLAVAEQRSAAKVEGGQTSDNLTTEAEDEDEDDDEDFLQEEEEQSEDAALRDDFRRARRYKMHEAESLIKRAKEKIEAQLEAETRKAAHSPTGDGTGPNERTGSGGKDGAQSSTAGASAATTPEDSPQVQTAPSGGFGARLLRDILSRVQVTLEDVHVRYEDAYHTVPSRAFAMGLAVKKISLLENATPTGLGTDKAPSPNVSTWNKSVSIDSFAVYWNSLDDARADRQEITGLSQAPAATTQPAITTLSPTEDREPVSKLWAKLSSLRILELLQNLPASLASESLSAKTHLRSYDFIVGPFNLTLGASQTNTPVSPHSVSSPGSSDSSLARNPEPNETPKQIAQSLQAFSTQNAVPRTSIYLQIGELAVRLSERQFRDLAALAETWSASQRRLQIALALSTLPPLPPRPEGVTVKPPESLSGSRSRAPSAVLPTLQSSIETDFIGDMNELEQWDLMIGEQDALRLHEGDGLYGADTMSTADSFRTPPSMSRSLFPDDREDELDEDDSGFLGPSADAEYQYGAIPDHEETVGVKRFQEKDDLAIGRKSLHAMGITTTESKHTHERTALLAGEDSIKALTEAAEEVRQASLLQQKHAWYRSLWRAAASNVVQLQSGVPKLSWFAIKTGLAERREYTDLYMRHLGTSQAPRDGTASDTSAPWLPSLMLEERERLHALEKRLPSWKIALARLLAEEHIAEQKKLAIELAEKQTQAMNQTSGLAAQDSAQHQRQASASFLYGIGSWVKGLVTSKRASSITWDSESVVQDMRTLYKAITLPKERVRLVYESVLIDDLQVLLRDESVHSKDVKDSDSKRAGQAREDLKVLGPPVNARFDVTFQALSFTLIRRQASVLDFRPKHRSIGAQPIPKYDDPDLPGQDAVTDVNLHTTTRWRSDSTADLPFAADEHGSWDQAGSTRARAHSYGYEDDIQPRLESMIQPAAASLSQTEELAADTSDCEGKRIIPILRLTAAGCIRLEMRQTLGCWSVHARLWRISFQDASQLPQISGLGPECELLSRRQWDPVGIPAAEDEGAGARQVGRELAMPRWFSELDVLSSTRPSDEHPVAVLFIQTMPRLIDPSRRADLLCRALVTPLALTLSLPTITSIASFFATSPAAPAITKRAAALGTKVRTDLVATLTNRKLVDVDATLLNPCCIWPILDVETDHSTLTDSLRSRYVFIAECTSISLRTLPSPSDMTECANLSGIVYVEDAHDKQLTEAYLNQEYCHKTTELPPLTPYRSMRYDVMEARLAGASIRLVRASSKMFDDVDELLKCKATWIMGSDWSELRNAEISGSSTQFLGGVGVRILLFSNVINTSASRVLASTQDEHTQSTRSTRPSAQASGDSGAAIHPSKSRSAWRRMSLVTDGDATSSPLQLISTSPADEDPGVLLQGTISSIHIALNHAVVVAAFELMRDIMLAARHFERSITQGDGARSKSHHVGQALTLENVLGATVSRRTLIFEDRVAPRPSEVVAREATEAKEINPTAASSLASFVARIAAPMELGSHAVSFRELVPGDQHSLLRSLVPISRREQVARASALPADARYSGPQGAGLRDPEFWEQPSVAGHVTLRIIFAFDELSVSYSQLERGFTLAPIPSIASPPLALGVEANHGPRSRSQSTATPHPPTSKAFSPIRPGSALTAYRQFQKLRPPSVVGQSYEGDVVTGLASPTIIGSGGRSRSSSTCSSRSEERSGRADSDPESLVRPPNITAVLSGLWINVASRPGVLTMRAAGRHFIARELVPVDLSKVKAQLADESPHSGGWNYRYYYRPVMSVLAPRISPKTSDPPPASDSTAQEDILEPVDVIVRRDNGSNSLRFSIMMHPDPRISGSSHAKDPLAMVASTISGRRGVADPVGKFCIPVQFEALTSINGEGAGSTELTPRLSSHAFLLVFRQRADYLGRITILSEEASADPVGPEGAASARFVTLASVLEESRAELGSTQSSQGQSQNTAGRRLIPWKAHASLSLGDMDLSWSPATTALLVCEAARCVPASSSEVDANAQVGRQRLTRHPSIFDLLRIALRRNPGVGNVAGGAFPTASAIQNVLVSLPALDRLEQRGVFDISLAGVRVKVRDPLQDLMNVRNAVRMTSSGRRVSSYFSRDEAAFEDQLMANAKSAQGAGTTALVAVSEAKKVEIRIVRDSVSYIARLPEMLQQLLFQGKGHMVTTLHAQSTLEDRLGQGDRPQSSSEGDDSSENSEHTSVQRLSWVVLTHREVSEIKSRFWSLPDPHSQLMSHFYAHLGSLANVSHGLLAKHATGIEGFARLRVTGHAQSLQIRCSLPEGSTSFPVVLDAESGASNTALARIHFAFVDWGLRGTLIERLYQITRRTLIRLEPVVRVAVRRSQTRIAKGMSTTASTPIKNTQSYSASQSTDVADGIPASLQTEPAALAADEVVQNLLKAVPNIVAVMEKAQGYNDPVQYDDLALLTATGHEWTSMAPTRRMNIDEARTFTLHLGESSGFMYLQPLLGRVISYLIDHFVGALDAETYLLARYGVAPLPARSVRVSNAAAPSLKPHSTPPGDYHGAALPSEQSHSSPQPAVKESAEKVSIPSLESPAPKQSTRSPLHTFQRAKSIVRALFPGQRAADDENTKPLPESHQNDKEKEMKPQSAPQVEVTKPVAPPLEKVHHDRIVLLSISRALGIRRDGAGAPMFSGLLERFVLPLVVEHIRAAAKIPNSAQLSTASPASRTKAQFDPNSLVFASPALLFTRVVITASHPVIFVPRSMFATTGLALLPGSLSIEAGACLEAQPSPFVVLPLQLRPSDASNVPSEGLDLAQRIHKHRRTEVVISSNSTEIRPLELHKCEATTSADNECDHPIFATPRKELLAALSRRENTTYDSGMFSLCVQGMRFSLRLGATPPPLPPGTGLPLPLLAAVREQLGRVLIDPQDRALVTSADALPEAWTHCADTIIALEISGVAGALPLSTLAMISDLTGHNVLLDLNSWLQVNTQRSSATSGVDRTENPAIVRDKGVSDIPKITVEDDEHVSEADETETRGGLSTVELGERISQTDLESDTASDEGENLVLSRPVSSSASTATFDHASEYRYTGSFRFYASISSLAIDLLNDLEHVSIKDSPASLRPPTVARIHAEGLEANIYKRPSLVSVLGIATTQPSRLEAADSGSTSSARSPTAGPKKSSIRLAPTVESPLGRVFEANSLTMMTMMTSQLLHIFRCCPPDERHQSTTVSGSRKQPMLLETVFQCPNSRAHSFAEGHRSLYVYDDLDEYNLPHSRGEESGNYYRVSDDLNLTLTPLEVLFASFGIAEQTTKARMSAESQLSLGPWVAVPPGPRPPDVDKASNVPVLWLRIEDLGLAARRLDIEAHSPAIAPRMEWLSSTTRSLQECFSRLVGTHRDVRKMSLFYRNSQPANPRSLSIKGHTRDLRILFAYPEILVAKGSGHEKVEDSMTSSKRERESGASFLGNSLPSRLRSLRSATIRNIRLSRNLLTPVLVIDGTLGFELQFSAPVSVEVPRAIISRRVTHRSSRGLASMRSRSSRPASSANVLFTAATCDAQAIRVAILELPSRSMRAVPQYASPEKDAGGANRMPVDSCIPRLHRYERTIQLYLRETYSEDELLCSPLYANLVHALTQVKLPYQSPETNQIVVHETSSKGRALFSFSALPLGAPVPVLSLHRLLMTPSPLGGFRNVTSELVSSPLAPYATIEQLMKDSPHQGDESGTMDTLLPPKYRARSELPRLDQLDLSRIWVRLTLRRILYLQAFMEELGRDLAASRQRAVGAPEPDPSEPGPNVRNNQQWLLEKQSEPNVRTLLSTHAITLKGSPIALCYFEDPIFDKFIDAGAPPLGDRPVSQLLLSELARRYPRYPVDGVTTSSVERRSSSSPPSELSNEKGMPSSDVRVSLHASKAAGRARVVDPLKLSGVRVAALQALQQSLMFRPLLCAQVNPSLWTFEITSLSPDLGAVRIFSTSEPSPPSENSTSTISQDFPSEDDTDTETEGMEDEPVVRRPVLVFYNELLQIRNLFLTSPYSALSQEGLKSEELDNPGSESILSASLITRAPGWVPQLVVRGTGSLSTSLDYYRAQDRLRSGHSLPSALDRLSRIHGLSEVRSVPSSVPDESLQQPKSDTPFTQGFEAGAAATSIALIRRAFLAQKVGEGWEHMLSPVDIDLELEYTQSLRLPAGSKTPSVPLTDDSDPDWARSAGPAISLIPSKQEAPSRLRAAITSVSPVKPTLSLVSLRSILGALNHVVLAQRVSAQVPSTQFATLRRWYPYVRAIRMARGDLLGDYPLPSFPPVICSAESKASRSRGHRNSASEPENDTQKGTPARLSKSDQLTWFIINETGTKLVYAVRGLRMVQPANETDQEPLHWKVLDVGEEEALGPGPTLAHEEVASLVGTEEHGPTLRLILPFSWTLREGFVTLQRLGRSCHRLIPPCPLRDYGWDAPESCSIFVEVRRTPNSISVTLQPFAYFSNMAQRPLSMQLAQPLTISSLSGNIVLPSNSEQANALYSGESDELRIAKTAYPYIAPLLRHAVETAPTLRQLIGTLPNHFHPFEACPTMPESSGAPPCERLHLGPGVCMSVPISLPLALESDDEPTVESSVASGHDRSSPDAAVRSKALYDTWRIQPEEALHADYRSLGNSGWEWAQLPLSFSSISQTLTMRTLKLTEKHQHDTVFVDQNELHQTHGVPRVIWSVICRNKTDVTPASESGECDASSNISITAPYAQRPDSNDLYFTITAMRKVVKRPFDSNGSQPLYPLSVAITNPLVIHNELPFSIDFKVAIPNRESVRQHTLSQVLFHTGPKRSTARWFTHETTIRPGSSSAIPSLDLHAALYSNPPATISLTVRKSDGYVLHEVSNVPLLALLPRCFLASYTNSIKFAGSVISQHLPQGPPLPHPSFQFEWKGPTADLVRMDPPNNVLDAAAKHLITRLLSDRKMNEALEDDYEAQAFQLVRRMDAEGEDLLDLGGGAFETEDNSMFPGSQQVAFRKAKLSESDLAYDRQSVAHRSYLASREELSQQLSDIVDAEEEYYLEARAYRRWYRRRQMKLRQLQGGQARLPSRGSTEREAPGDDTDEDDVSEDYNDSELGGGTTHVMQGQLVPVCTSRRERMRRARNHPRFAASTEAYLFDPPAPTMIKANPLEADALVSKAILLASSPLAEAVNTSALLRPGCVLIARSAVVLPGLWGSSSLSNQDMNPPWLWPGPAAFALGISIQSPYMYENLTGLHLRTGMTMRPATLKLVSLRHRIKQPLLDAITLGSLRLARECLVQRATKLQSLQDELRRTEQAKSTASEQEDQPSPNQPSRVPKPLHATSLELPIHVEGWMDSRLHASTLVAPTTPEPSHASYDEACDATSLNEFDSESDSDDEMADGVSPINPDTISSKESKMLTCWRNPSLYPIAAVVQLKMIPERFVLIPNFIVALEELASIKLTDMYFALEAGWIPHADLISGQDGVLSASSSADMLAQTMPWLARLRRALKVLQRASKVEYELLAQRDKLLRLWLQQGVCSRRSRWVYIPSSRPIALSLERRCFESDLVAESPLTSKLIAHAEQARDVAAQQVNWIVKAGAAGGSVQALRSDGYVSEFGLQQSTDCGYDEIIEVRVVRSTSLGLEKMEHNSQYPQSGGLIYTQLHSASVFIDGQCTRVLRQPNSQWYEKVGMRMWNTATSAVPSITQMNANPGVQYPPYDVAPGWRAIEPWRLLSITGRDPGLKDDSTWDDVECDLPTSDLLQKYMSLCALPQLEPEQMKWQPHHLALIFSLLRKALYGPKPADAGMISPSSDTAPSLGSAKLQMRRWKVARVPLNSQSVITLQQTMLPFIPNSERTGRQSASISSNSSSFRLPPILPPSSPLLASALWTVFALADSPIPHERDNTLFSLKAFDPAISTHFLPGEHGNLQLQALTVAQSWSEPLDAPALHEQTQGCAVPISLRVKTILAAPAPTKLGFFTAHSQFDLVLCSEPKALDQEAIRSEKLDWWSGGGKDHMVAAPTSSPKLRLSPRYILVNETNASLVVARCLEFGPLPPVPFDADQVLADKKPPSEVAALPLRPNATAYTFGRSSRAIIMAPGARSPLYWVEVHNPADAALPYVQTSQLPENHQNSGTDDWRLLSSCPLVRLALPGYHWSAPLLLRDGLNVTLRFHTINRSSQVGNVTQASVPVRAEELATFMMSQTTRLLRIVCDERDGTLIIRVQNADAGSETRPLRFINETGLTVFVRQVNLRRKLRIIQLQTVPQTPPSGLSAETSDTVSRRISSAVVVLPEHDEGWMAIPSTTPDAVFTWEQDPSTLPLYRAKSLTDSQADPDASSAAEFLPKRPSPYDFLPSLTFAFVRPDAPLATIKRQAKPSPDIVEVKAALVARECILDYVPFELTAAQMESLDRGPSRDAAPERTQVVPALDVPLGRLPNVGIEVVFEPSGSVVLKRRQVVSTPPMGLSSQADTVKSTSEFVASSTSAPNPQSTSGISGPSIALPLHLALAGSTRTSQMGPKVMNDISSGKRSLSRPSRTAVVTENIIYPQEALGTPRGLQSITLSFALAAARFSFVDLKNFEFAALHLFGLSVIHTSSLRTVESSQQTLPLMAKDKPHIVSDANSNVHAFPHQVEAKQGTSPRVTLQLGNSRHRLRVSAGALILEHYDPRGKMPVVAKTLSTELVGANEDSNRPLNGAFVIDVVWSLDAPTSNGIRESSTWLASRHHPTLTISLFRWIPAPLAVCLDGVFIDRCLRYAAMLGKILECRKNLTQDYSPSLRFEDRTVESIVNGVMESERILTNSHTQSTAARRRPKVEHHPHQQLAGNSTSPHALTEGLLCWISQRLHSLHKGALVNDHRMAHIPVLTSAPASKLDQMGQYSVDSKPITPRLHEDAPNKQTIIHLRRLEVGKLILSLTLALRGTADERARDGHTDASTEPGNAAENDGTSASDLVPPIRRILSRVLGTHLAQYGLQGPVLSRFLEHTLAALGNLRDAQLEISPTHLVSVRGAARRVLGDVISHIQPKLVKSLPVLLGHVQAFGDPLALIRHLTRGVGDLVTLPFTGFVGRSQGFQSEQPHPANSSHTSITMSDNTRNRLTGGLVGLGQGITSFVRHGISGAASTLGAVASTASGVVSSIASVATRPTGERATKRARRLDVIEVYARSEPGLAGAWTLGLPVFDDPCQIGSHSLYQTVLFLFLLHRHSLSRLGKQNRFVLPRLVAPVCLRLMPSEAFRHLNLHVLQAKAGQSIGVSSDIPNTNFALLASTRAPAPGAIQARDNQNGASSGILTSIGTGLVDVVATPLTHVLNATAGLADRLRSVSSIPSANDSGPASESSTALNRILGPNDYTLLPLPRLVARVGVHVPLPPIDGVLNAIEQCCFTTTGAFIPELLFALSAAGQDVTSLVHAGHLRKATHPRGSMNHWIWSGWPRSNQVGKLSQFLYDFEQVTTVMCKYFEPFHPAGSIPILEVSSGLQQRVDLHNSWRVFESEQHLHTVLTVCSGSALHLIDPLLTESEMAKLAGTVVPIGFFVTNKALYCVRFFLTPDLNEIRLRDPRKPLFRQNPMSCVKAACECEIDPTRPNFADLDEETVEEIRERRSRHQTLWRIPFSVVESIQLFPAVSAEIFDNCFAASQGRSSSSRSTTADPEAALHSQSHSLPILAMRLRGALTALQTTGTHSGNQPQGTPTHGSVSIPDTELDALIPIPLPSLLCGIQLVQAIPGSRVPFS